MERTREQMSAESRVNAKATNMHGEPSPVAEPEPTKAVESKG